MLIEALLLTASLTTPEVERSWAARAYEDTEDGRLQHARSFVRDHAAAATLEQQIVAHVTIGDILWQRSCPNEDGCVRHRVPDEPGKSKRRRARRRGRSSRVALSRCGPKHRPIYQVTERRRSLATEGQRHLSIALELADALRPGKPRSEELSEAIASARFLVLEPRFEAFVPLEVPSIQQALASVLEHRRQEEMALAEEYRSIVQLGVERWALAALARIGDLPETTADQLWTAPVPRSLRNHEDRAFVYCDALDAAAVPLWHRASAAYVTCLETGIRWAAVDGPALRCEAQVQGTHVDQYPATHEFFGRSVYERSTMVSFGVQLEAEPAQPIVVRHSARPASR